MKKRYVVYLGNGEVIECYRTLWDMLIPVIWFESGTFVRFRLAVGTVVNGKPLDKEAIMRVSKHFTIRVVEVGNGE